MASALDKGTSTGALSELHIDGFDAEQIWLQLDMASAQLVRRAKRLLNKAGTDPDLLTLDRQQDLTGQSLMLAPLLLTLFSIIDIRLCRNCKLAIT